jgi:hypothetical protein
MNMDMKQCNYFEYKNNILLLCFIQVYCIQLDNISRKNAKKTK